MNFFKLNTHENPDEPMLCYEAEAWLSWSRPKMIFLLSLSAPLEALEVPAIQTGSLPFHPPHTYLNRINRKNAATFL